MSVLSINEPEPFVLQKEEQDIIQQKVSSIDIPWFESLHRPSDVPKDFLPWNCKLSPSALYTCSLKCRKKMGIKTPETKWMSIRRWITTTPAGIELPKGVYLSIKRREDYEPFPQPHIVKTEFILLMFPYGNVWSQAEPEVPITEEWMWKEVGGMLMLERLMRKDAANPIIGYFKKVHDYLINNPDQIGIHLKRNKKT